MRTKPCLSESRVSQDSLHQPTHIRINSSSRLTELIRYTMELDYGQQVCHGVECWPVWCSGLNLCTATESQIWRS